MSFTLIGTPEQATAAIQQVAAQRYVAGANRDSERQMYKQALRQAVKCPSSKTREVVISRCDENISWIAELQTKDVIVYNKGKTGDHNRLVNVGREAHTYFRHIVINYTRLRDVTFFLQGWPFDRSTCVPDGINELSNFDFIEFGSDILETGPIEVPMIPFWNSIFQEPCPRSPWPFRANSQFGVSRSRILKRPITFYSDCMRACEIGMPDVSIASIPYLFEQVWWKVFE